MPAIRKAARRISSPAEPRRQSERLRPRPAAASSAPTDALAPGRSPTPATHFSPTPPNPDHVHAAQARFRHIHAACADPHALAMLGRISTENARLTRKLPPLRHQMHDLMLQCLPLASIDRSTPDFGQRRDDLNRLSCDMAGLHQLALALEYRLQACVLQGNFTALRLIDVDFKRLNAQATKAIDESRVVSASLGRHLAVIRTSQVRRPLLIAPWHLLPPLGVPANALEGEHCPLSMASLYDIVEPLVLPLGDGLQLYSRFELEMWLHTSKQHNVDEYVFLNPTSNTWEKFSALRRLVIVAEA